MPRYSRRREFVEAERFWPPAIPDCVERGRDGVWRMDPGLGGMPKVIKPGHWIVTDERGVRIALRPESFEADYELAE